MFIKLLKLMYDIIYFTLFFNIVIMQKVTKPRSSQL